MDQLNRAIQLREFGNYEEARSLLLGLLDQYPLNSAIWYQCAWIHDVMGLESEAVPYYKQALELGLSGEEKQGAILGLGSTYRTLGLYKEAQTVFEEAIQEFPERGEFRVFYAMVLYNRQAYSEAMGILLKQLAETSTDQGIQDYKKAILFYAHQLDRVWD